MASEVQIANLALDTIGARATIASFAENSNEARLITRQYARARDDVLSAAHWNFARKQVVLTMLKDATDGDSVPTPWLYEYAYPADCLQCRFLMPTVVADAEVPGAGSVGVPRELGRPIFFIVSTDVDDNGEPVKVLLTNQPQAELVYTFQLTNPQLFDQQFTSALSNYLGALIAMALTGDRSKARAAFEIAEAATRSARATNGNEGGPTTLDVVPDWISVRGYSADFGQAYSPYVMPPTNLVFLS